MRAPPRAVLSSTTSVLIAPFREPFAKDTEAPLLWAAPAAICWRLCAGDGRPTLGRAAHQTPIRAVAGAVIEFHKPEWERLGTWAHQFSM